MLPIVMFVAMFANFFGSYLLKIRWTTPRNHILFFGGLGISGCYSSTFFKEDFMPFMLLFTISFGLVNGATYMTAVSVAWQYFPGKSIQTGTQSFQILKYRLSSGPSETGA